MQENIPVPLLDLKAQYATIRTEIDDAIRRVVESQFFILGPEVEALEREVAAYCQCKYGVGVSSGTDALLIALMAINLQPGDEAIVPPYSFFATAGAVARLGAKPVFVDISADTFNLNPAGLEQAITAKTRAIIPVHLFGQMADMDPILAVARKHNLYVIEDAAQAIGADYIGAEHKGWRAGSMGHMSCFSFFPSKNLGGFGDGGMVTTCDSGLSDRLKLLRNHGQQPKYYNRVVGGNFRLDAIQAAVLRVKLKYLDQWTAARQQNARRYHTLFAEYGLSDVQPGVILPVQVTPGRHIFNQFVIRVPRRNELIEYLKARQIGTEIYYPVPLHLQECFSNSGYQPGDFPASERAATETLALPIYPELSEELQRVVVQAIANFFAAAIR